MGLIDEFPDGAVDLYADALSRVATALAKQDVISALKGLKPISAELWHGAVKTIRATSSPLPGARPRAVSDKTRARVFLRDRFRCSLCGGRGIPRCVMVGISDVFPDVFAYDVHYGRGRIHPAYWALALEADHTVPHANGGAGNEENLTAMHALCNTRKSVAALHEVGSIEQLGEQSSWDGLISAYPGIVLAGNSQGRRHSALGYHRRWLRRFELIPLGDEMSPG